MKALLLVGMIFFSTFCRADQSPSPQEQVTGVVLDVTDAGGYSYLRLMTPEGETWAAVSHAELVAGSRVTIDHVIVMKNFESRSLNKTFPSIFFGNLAGEAGADSAEKIAPVAAIHVEKAVGAHARTVEEVVSGAAQLKDKPVLIRGQIVKYNQGILGKNWIHLRDGSGAEGGNDILVTSASAAKVGDVVTVKGVVRTDRDFGAGYFYKVLIEGEIQGR
ncbi:MAG: nucleotide-binding protein [Gallionella sp.]|nr:nucleotide-binding protein [Gallionella sp.]